MVVCVFSCSDLACRSAAVAAASPALTFAASCSSIAAATVGLCTFAVSDELNADVFASNLRFHPEN